MAVGFVLLWCSTAEAVHACPFCTAGGQTLTGEVNQATVVLYGKMVNANADKDTTDLEVEAVVKEHAKLPRGTKKVVLNKYVPEPLDKGDYRYLVFCDFFKGQLDAYRGVAVKAGSKMPAYLQGALQAKDKKIGDRLRFFFDYLDNDDIEVSNDAYKEFANADYKDYVEMAKGLPAERIAGWLQDPNTPAFRFGLYGSMLGHCGTKKHAGQLRKLLDDPDRREVSGVDGIMAGYLLLEPKDGWKYAVENLKNAKNEFMFRFAILKAIRFFRDYRPDLVSKKELTDAVCLLLNQEDMADLGVEELRRWQQWDKADNVLAICNTPAYKQSIVRRSILRYCLQCKGSSAAAAYVEKRRKADPETVKEAEELLKLEQESTPPPKPDNK
jgi:hypothetical protein